MAKIPKFIGGSECLIIEEYSNVCFLHGSYGSPAIADTVETLIALGVQDMILIGMCGRFSNKVNEEDRSWDWGNSNFKSIKDKFINNSIKYAIDGEQ